MKISFSRVNSAVEYDVETYMQSKAADHDLGLKSTNRLHLFLAGV